MPEPMAEWQRWVEQRRFWTESPPAILAAEMYSYARGHYASLEVWPEPGKIKPATWTTIRCQELAAGFSAEARREYDREGWVDGPVSTATIG